jgi:lipoate---protein ligase
MKKWRLIPFLEADGQLQMIIDQWLLNQHQLGKIPPTLRFYTWFPVAISLGYHQKNYPLFWHDLTYQNFPIDIIRRPSGGRGVLHQGDLTYMIVTSDFMGKRLEVYQHICEFLINGWGELGYHLDYGKTSRGYIHNSSCFSTATGADLILENGYKLIGSAQFKKGQTILQHGSIRLFPDVNLHLQVFPNSEKINPIFTDIQEPNLFKETIINTLITSAKKCFNIELILEPFSPQEWTDILNFKNNTLCHFSNQ